jgi:hypothetical protein
MKEHGSQDDIYHRLFDVIARETNYPRHKLTPYTVIQRNIGCDGDDAVELLNAIASEFKVDFSGIDFFKFFGSESWFHPQNFREKTDLTVADLHASVCTGRWLDPPSDRHVRNPIPGAIVFIVLIVATAMCFAIFGKWH